MIIWNLYVFFYLRDIVQIVLTIRFYHDVKYCGKIFFYQCKQKLVSSMCSYLKKKRNLIEYNKCLFIENMIFGYCLIEAYTTSPFSVCRNTFRKNIILLISHYLLMRNTKSYIKIILYRIGNMKVLHQHRFVCKVTCKSKPCIVDLWFSPQVVKLYLFRYPDWVCK